MSFTRRTYDASEDAAYVRETTGPGLYHLKPPLDQSGCYQDNPQVIMQKTGVSMDNNAAWRFYNGPIDVENNLRYWRESRCPRCSVALAQGETACPNCPAPKKQPTCHFPVDNTRLSNPAFNLRGSGIDRFFQPCNNPQDHEVNFPTEYFINTRIVAKDAFGGRY